TSSTKAWVELLSGDERGRAYPIDREITSLGRGSAASIPLADPNQLLSRHHAEIRWQDGQCQLVGLGTNGTRVGNRTVGQEPRTLNDGDLIVLAGKIKLRFHLARPTAAADPQPQDSAGPSEEPSIVTPGRRWNLLRSPLVLSGILLWGSV